MRDWVTDLFPFDQRSTQLFQSKFSEAAMVDFKVAKCRNHKELMQLLSTDDTVEIILRSLAAYIHHRRTGDTDASANMLAIRAPGAMTDIAPPWMVSDSSQYSKLESQRKDRGRKGSGAKGGNADNKPKAAAKPKSMAKGGSRGPPQSGN